MTAAPPATRGQPGDHGDGSDDRGSAIAIRRRALGGLAVGATTLVAVAYLLAVRTVWGQRLDATALRGRHVVVSRRAFRVARDLHGTISIASLVLLGGAVVLVALARRRPRLAVGAGVIIAGSLLTTEALKRVLPRPDFGVSQLLRDRATFPSGHTTIAMALGVSAVLVAPRRFRGRVAVVATAFASLVGCSMLATASHRPSDMIGAALVVTAWAASVSLVLLRDTPARATTPRPILTINPVLAATGVALLSASFVGVAFVAVAIHYGRLETVGTGRAFLAAGAAIVGTVLVCAAALLYALGPAELDPPRRGDRRALTSSA